MDALGGYVALRLQASNVELTNMRKAVLLGCPSSSWAIAPKTRRLGRPRRELNADHLDNLDIAAGVTANVTSQRWLMGRQARASVEVMRC
jgi:hypothetical protein